MPSPSPASYSHTRRFAKPDRRTWVCSGLATAHFAAITLSQTLRVEHVIVDLAMIVAAWHYGRGRDLATAALPLWAAGGLMDAQRFFIQWRGVVHTGDVWLF